MSYIYRAEIEGHADFDITADDIKDLDLRNTDNGTYHILDGNKGYRIQVVEADHANKTYHLIVDGKRLVVTLKDRVEVQVHEMGLDDVDALQKSEIHAPMPGLVLKVSVEKGQDVEEGDELLILEAMKMENVISAPAAGTIAEVAVKDGQPVDKGALLLRFKV